MICDPVGSIRKFHDHFLYGNKDDEDLTTSLYYRALLVSPDVKKAKACFRNGNITLFNMWVEHCVNHYEKDHEKRSKQAEDTLLSILRFHLNNFEGFPKTNENMEKIEKELNRILFLIFGSKSISASILDSEDGVFSVQIKEI